MAFETQGLAGPWRGCLVPRHTPSSPLLCRPSASSLLGLISSGSFFCRSWDQGARLSAGLCRGELGVGCSWLGGPECSGPSCVCAAASAMGCRAPWHGDVRAVSAPASRADPSAALQGPATLGGALEPWARHGRDQCIPSGVSQLQEKPSTDPARSPAPGSSTQACFTDARPQSSQSRPGVRMYVWMAPHSSPWVWPQVTPWGSSPLTPPQVPWVPQESLKMQGGGSRLPEARPPGMPPWLWVLCL